MNPRPAARDFPILEAAAALGLQVEGRLARCFNAAGHKGGNDANPSLTFFPGVNGFKCYACGTKGDTITLVRAVQGVGYGEAVAWLEGRVGKALTAAVPVAGTNVMRAFPDEQAREVYATLFERSFTIKSATPAGQYLLKRGIDLGLANECGAGQMGNPGTLWVELLDKFGLERLKAAGLVSHAGHFLFSKHALLFFYFDDGNRPVYVQARDVTGKAQCKELSLAGLRSPAPFNADLFAQRPDRVCICEGCIDTLSALQLGYPAVGVPGVTGFLPEWFNRFQGVGHVQILFDNDEAGRRQAAELRSQFRVRGMKADALHPQGEGIKDMNDLLLNTRNQE